MIEWEDIVDSVQLDRVLDDLGIKVSSIIKREHWASCQLPTHPSADASPSFSVNEDTLLWNCFTCNAGGLLPSLVAQMLGFETDQDYDREDPTTQTAFQKGVEWLLPYSDVDVNSDAGFQEQLDRYLERTREKTVKRRSKFKRLPFFNPQVLDSLDYCPIELLEKWHIFEERTVERWGLRYDPERTREKNGKHYSGPAIVIPHYFRGDLVGYQERWLDPERPKWIPKYTNTDGFPKAETLFGYDIALGAAQEGCPVTVVEAAMTVIRLWEIDTPGIGTFGASVGETQIDLLRGFRPGLILARDEDPDYINQKGERVHGAGIQNFWANADRLSGNVPIWKLPPVPQQKGDLADLDDAEVEALYARQRAVFALQTPPKKRQSR